MSCLLQNTIYGKNNLRNSEVKTNACLHTMGNCCISSDLRDCATTLGVWLGLLWHFLGSWCISSKSLSLDADLQRVWNSYSTSITFTWPSSHNHSCCPHCCQRTLWTAFRHIPRQITMVSRHPSWHSHFNICTTGEPQQGWFDEKDAAQDCTWEGWGEEGRVFALYSKWFF